MPQCANWTSECPQEGISLEQFEKLVLIVHLKVTRDKETMAKDIILLII